MTSATRVEVVAWCRPSRRWAAAGRRWLVAGAVAPDGGVATRRRGAGAAAAWGSGIRRTFTPNRSVRSE